MANVIAWSLFLEKVVVGLTAADSGIVHSDNRWYLIKRVLRLSIPMAGSRLLQMLSGFIGMLMVAHLGSYALAASALIGGVQTMLIVLAICLLFSISVAVGEAFGADRRGEIGAIGQQGMVLSFVISIPFAISLWFSPQILLWFGQSPQLIAHIYGYFHVMAFFAFPILIQTVLQQCAYGVLKQRVVIIVNIINLILFPPYAYYLIFGYGHFHGWGLAGASLAWGIQDILNIGMLLWAFYAVKEFKQYGFFIKHSFQGWVHLRKLFQIGWPMSIQFGAEISALFMRTIFIGWLGLTALAAGQVIQQCIFLLIVPLFAMSEAAGILVSQYKGADLPKMIGRAGNTAVVVAIIFCLVPIIVFAIFPHWLASLYINVNLPANFAIFKLVRLLFLISIVNFTLAVVGDMFAGALRGLFDTRFAMMNSIFFSWGMNIPLSYVFAFVLHWGVVGVFLGSSVAFACRAAGVWWRWRKQIKRLHFFTLNQKM